MRMQVRRARRRAVKLLGVCLAAALVGAGGAAAVSTLRDSSPELQRPDLLVAMGVCVAVWLGGAASSADEASPEA